MYTHGWLPIFTPWLRATILTKSTCYYVIFYVLITVLVAFDAAGTDSGTQRSWYRLMHYLTEDGPLKYSTVVIFPLAMFVANLLKQDYDTRQTYNEIMNNTCDVALNIATLVLPRDVHVEGSHNMEGPIDHRVDLIRRNIGEPTTS